MNINVPLWLAFAVFIGVITASSAQGRLAGQYEFTRRGRFRFAVTRRWYGTGAHISLRSNADQGFRVISWSDDDTEVPWLLVVLYRGTSWRLSEEDTEEPSPFWAPVTMFAPYTVPVLRPHVLEVRGRRIPQLKDYRPVRNPSGHLDEVRDAA